MRCIIKNIFYLLLIVMNLTLASGCSAPEAKKIKFFEKAKALCEKGDYVRARLELKNAVQVDPKFALGYYHLGPTCDHPTRLVESMRGLYWGRVYSFMNDTWELTSAECEEPIRQQGERVFQRRGELIERLETGQ